MFRVKIEANIEINFIGMLGVSRGMLGVLGVW